MNTTNSLLLAAIVTVVTRYSAGLDKRSARYGKPMFKEIFGLFMVAFFILALDTARPDLAQKLSWLFLAGVTATYGLELFSRITGQQFTIDKITQYSPAYTPGTLPIIPR